MSATPKATLKALVIAGLMIGFAPQGMSDDETPKDETAKDEKEQTALADFKALKRYAPTGEVKRCISLNRIQNTRVLDDQTILFKMRGRKHYVNRLSHACPSLKREERFMYKTSIGQLCSIDIITVLDSFGRSWASCGLGKFEEIKLKPKKDIEAESKADSKSNP